MAAYLGDYDEDETVHFIWNTYDSSGASITRATDGTVSVYKDNGVSQSTAGVTDTEDFDSLTGIHACTIDLSADAFYATGANYTVVLSGATIDGQSVNAVLAHFSIENRFTIEAVSPSCIDWGLIKQSTAVTKTIGPLLSYRTAAPKTSLTVGDITAATIKGSTRATITLTASGGSNDFVHLGDGYWSLELTATNTNTLGEFKVTLRDDDVIQPVVATGLVVPANIYDSLISGSDYIDVSVVQWLGTAVTAATAGRPDVNVAAISDDTDDADDLGAAIDNANNLVKSNVTAVSDDTTAATNLEAMYDGTGYVGGTIKLEVDVQEIDGATDAADGLRRMCDASLSPASAAFQVTNASFAPTTTQFETTSGDSTDDHYNGGYVVWTSSTDLFGARYEITDYDGTNKRFTVATMVAAPANNDQFVIV